MNRKLSVIVPAYRESVNIQNNLVRLQVELDKLGREYEIIVVCDGCDDTYHAARKVTSDRLKIYHYSHNMGKGYALKYGAARTTGDLVTFIDADMSIDPQEIDAFIKLMDVYNSDIVIGSKRHPQSKVNYPLFRRFQSFVYQMLIAVLFQITVRDTQTGLKLFRREVLLNVVPRVVVKAYAFDLELLVVAHHLGYRNVIEAPIKIKEQFATTTSLGAAWRVLWDTLAIFYRQRVLKYYDQDHIFIEMLKSELTVSVVIPVKKINDYVRESVTHLADMSYKKYEVLIFPDEGEKPPGFPDNVRVIATGPIGPAEKRDLSLRYSTGEILAFLDDDAYPRQDWLINAVRHFHRDEVAAVVGPAITAENDDVFCQASGAVYESRLGGGSITYRYLPRMPRQVDDYPSVNFLIRKSVFEQVGGFDTHYWPGEDTKLCLDVTNMGLKIIYDPDVQVWHHRRKLFIPHLKQVSRYAEHRGYFAKRYPKTSFRLVYFLPSLFVVGLVGGTAVSVVSHVLALVYISTILVYLLALAAAAFWATLMHTSLRVGLLTAPGIFATHIVYGVFFIKGLLTRRLRR